MAATLRFTAGAGGEIKFLFGCTFLSFTDASMFVPKCIQRSIIIMYMGLLGIQPCVRRAHVVTKMEWVMIWCSAPGLPVHQNFNRYEEMQFLHISWATQF